MSVMLCRLKRTSLLGMGMDSRRLYWQCNPRYNSRRIIRCSRHFNSRNEKAAALPRYLFLFSQPRIIIQLFYSTLNSSKAKDHLRSLFVFVPRSSRCFPTFLFPIDIRSTFALHRSEAMI